MNDQKSVFFLSSILIKHPKKGGWGHFLLRRRRRCVPTVKAHLTGGLADVSEVCLGEGTISGVQDIIHSP